MLLRGVGQTLMQYVEKTQIRFRRCQKTLAIKLLLKSSSLSVSLHPPLRIKQLYLHGMDFY